MSERKYAFRREDNGEVVWVDWPTMMEQKFGFITLPDGVEARRCVHLEEQPESSSASAPKHAGSMPVVSDSLGFPVQALADRKAQLKVLKEQHGIQGIEFRPDPQQPHFYQVHCASENARDEYAAKRNMVNRTGTLGAGAMLSPALLERAEEMVSRDRQDEVASEELGGLSKLASQREIAW